MPDGCRVSWVRHHALGMHALYFAYGSNMDEQDMCASCPSCRYLGSAYLDGHQLAFTRRSVRSGTGVADVVPAVGHAVWGALYEVGDKDLDALDQKEGNGWAYVRERKRVRLATDNSEHDAITYTVVAKELAEVPPSREYLDRIIAAAGHRALPEGYIATLEAIQAEPR